MGQKFKKLKNDVLEIAVDQWNERVRPWLANEICLFAFFPHAMLLLITTVVSKFLFIDLSIFKQKIWFSISNVFLEKYIIWSVREFWMSFYKFSASYTI